MIRKSQTFSALIRLIKALPPLRKRTLLALLPLAIVSGLSDLVVLGLVARLFTVVIGQANDPPLPWPDLAPADPRLRVIVLVFAYIVASWFSSVSKLFLRAAQVRLKAVIWRDLSEMAQIGRAHV